jgi:hypothetical protein
VWLIKKDVVGAVRYEICIVPTGSLVRGHVEERYS